MHASGHHRQGKEETTILMARRYITNVGQIAMTYE